MLYVWLLLPSVWSFAILPTGTLPKHPTLRSTIHLASNKEENDEGDIRHESNTENRKTKDKENEKWKLSKPTYSDEFLFNFHNQAQEEKQLETNSLVVWNDNIAREHEKISEWKDSFDRNGLADFCPPMNVGMNCLIVGDGSTLFERDERGGDVVSHMDNAPSEIGEEKLRRDDQLPWEDTPGAYVTSLHEVMPRTINGGLSLRQGDSSLADEINASTLTSPLSEWQTQLRPQLDRDTSSSSTWLHVADPERPAAAYDCIVDQGLMGSVLALEEKASRGKVVRRLLLEAATAIREHGIYVLVTPTMSEETQDLILDGSREAGLEWQFALDGISDELQVVSVARRYNNGAMPKIGRLSRFQP